MNPINYSCAGLNCPSKSNCGRYSTEAEGHEIVYAAFWTRRESGASACDGYQPKVITTTFKDAA